MKAVVQYIVKFSLGFALTLVVLAGASAQGPSVAEPSKGIGRLRELEIKAEERDRMAERSRQLEEELSALQKQLGGGDDASPRSGRGRLDMLERKAAQFEQVVLINEAKTEQIRLLLEENDELRLAMNETEAQYIDLQNTQHATISSNEFLHGIIGALQQTIDQLLLGNFEYYEVRREGETLSSIAGLPMVYGDTNKANWLVAPNIKRVQDLNKLEEGEVLVIPRFPASGRYLW